MKLEFNKRRQVVHLLLGIVFIALGLTSILLEDGSIFNYFNLMIGVVYLVYYSYNHFKGFGILKDKTLQINGWKSKTIHFENLIEVRHFAVDLILKTNSLKISIANNTLTKASRELLENNSFIRGFNKESSLEK